MVTGRGRHPSEKFKLATDRRTPALARQRDAVFFIYSTVGARSCPTVVRARPPANYEKTITSYFDLKIKGPQPNRVLSIGKPEARWLSGGRTGQLRARLGGAGPVRDPHRRIDGQEGGHRRDGQGALLLVQAGTPSTA
jgi:hypothetical protein